MKKLFIFFFLILVIFSVGSFAQQLPNGYDYSYDVAPSKNPPNGLSASEVPLFVYFGVDDLTLYEGLDWLLDLCDRYTNADGSPIRFSWFGNAMYELEPEAVDQDENATMSAMKQIMHRIKVEGHEYGIHSYSHIDLNGNWNPVEIGEGMWLGQLPRDDQWSAYAWIGDANDLDGDGYKTPPVGTTGLGSDPFPSHPEDTYWVQTADNDPWAHNTDAQFPRYDGSDGPVTWVNVDGGILRDMGDYKKPYAATEDTAFCAGWNATNIWGWRTPFLSWNEPMFKALRYLHFVYDCSVQEGWSSDAYNPGDMYWPYTLKSGGRGSTSGPAQKLAFEPSGRHSYSDLSDSYYQGMWLIPVYAWVVPTTYNGHTIRSKYSANLANRAGDSTKDRGVGYDSSLFDAPVNMSWQDYADTIKYNMDGRAAGNGAPFHHGTHDFYYDPVYDIWETNLPTTYIERREALEDMLNYLLPGRVDRDGRSASYASRVRIVPMKEVVKWMMNPVNLTTFDQNHQNELGPIATRFTNPNLDVSIDDTFTINLEVRNWGSATVNNINVTFKIPGGFTLLSGNKTQTISSLTAGSKQMISWTLKAPSVKGYANIETKSTYTYSSVDYTVEAVDTFSVGGRGGPGETFDVWALQLYSPTNGTITKTTPTFIWQKMDNATSYDIAIGATTNNVSGTNYTPSLADGVYDWKVRAVYGSTKGPWSDVWNVTIDQTPPNIVSLMTPSSNSTIAQTSTTLEWYVTTDNVAGIGGYILEFDDNAGFSSPTKISQTNISYAISSLNNGSTYYWRVKAYDTFANTNDWSSVWFFTVDTTQIIPALLSPTNNAFSQDATPTFVWSKPTDVDNYQIVVDSVTQTTVNTQYTSGTLSEGAHQWKVRAHKQSTGQWQAWTSYFVYNVDTTGPSSPNLVSPLNGSTTLLTKPTFVWNSGTDASGIYGYKIELDSIEYSVSTTNYTPASDLSAGSHTWRVCAIDGLNNQGVWSALWSVTITTNIPAAPGEIDFFESDPLGSNPPYSNQNMDPNKLTGAWYCIDDQDEVFTAAKHSRALSMDIIADAADGSSKSLVSSYTIGVANSAADEWPAWELDCTLSSNEAEQNVSSKTLDFWAKAASPYSIKVVMKPTDLKAENNYAWDLYYHMINLTTTWQHFTLPIDSNTFKQDGWGTTVPWNTAVNEVIAFTWMEDAPESGNPQFRKLYLDQVKYLLGSTPPEITSLSAFETNDGSGKVIIRYTGKDSGGATCTYVIAQYSTDNSSWNNMTAGSSDSRHISSPLPFTTGGAEISYVWDSKTDLPSTYDGSVWVRFQVNNGSVDSAITASGSFVVDNKVPNQITLISPQDSVTTNDTTPTFTWNTGVDDSSIVNYELIIDSSSYDVTTTTYTPVSSLTDGQYLWKVRAFDVYGNVGNYSVARTLTIDTKSSNTNSDTTPPSIPSLVSPNDNIWTNDNMPTFTWNASSDASGIAGYDIVIDSSTNSISGTTYTPGSGLSEGSHTWTVRARDNAGNKSAFSTSRVIKIDTINPGTPALSSPSDSATVSSPVSFSWSASSESGSGIAYYIVDIDDTSTAFASIVKTTNVSGTSVSLTLGSGTFYWRVRGYDNAGNISSYQSRSFTINTVDTTPPSIPSLVSPGSNSWVTNNKPTFVWNKSTDNVGVTGYIIEIDGSTNSVSTTNYTPTGSLSDSSHTWRVTAKDAAGNTNWSSSWTVQIDTSDPGTPSLSSPTNGATTNDATPTFTWNSVSDTGSGIARYDIEIGSTTYDAGNSTSYTPTSGLGNGTHNWRVRAVDVAGNVGSWSSQWSVTVNVTGPDTTPPSIPNLVSPANNSWVTNNKPTFVWNKSTDNIGITGYTIEIDGGIYTVGTTNYTPSVALSEGTHTWRVTAKDAAGNTNWSSSWTVQIDTSDPGTPSLSSPTNGATTNDATPTFTWNSVSDTGSGIARYDIEIDSTTYDAGNSTSYTPSTGLTNGNYHWRVRAVDVAGNVGAWSAQLSMTVAVDTNAPTAPTQFYPADGSVSSTSTITFSWSGASDDMGIDSYDILIDGNSMNVSGTSYMVTLSEGTHSWRVRTVDTSGNKSSWSSEQFVIVNGAPDIEVNTFRVTPNPLTKSDGEMLIEFNSGDVSSDDVSFEVYTIVGTRVAHISTFNSYKAYWKGTNENGKEVASGVYFMIMRVKGNVVYKLKIGYTRK